MRLSALVQCNAVRSPFVNPTGADWSCLCQDVSKVAKLASMALNNIVLDLAPHVDLLPSAFSGGHWCWRRVRWLKSRLQRVGAHKPARNLQSKLSHHSAGLAANREGGREEIKDCRLQGSRFCRPTRYPRQLQIVARTLSAWGSGLGPV